MVLCTVVVSNGNIFFFWQFKRTLWWWKI